jgi:hypothetical protein
MVLMVELKGDSPRMCKMIRFSGDNGSIRRNLYADVSLNGLQGVLTYSFAVQLLQHLTNQRKKMVCVTVKQN